MNDCTDAVSCMTLFTSDNMMVYIVLPSFSSCQWLSYTVHQCHRWHKYLHPKTCSKQFSVYTTITLVGSNKDTKHWACFCTAAIKWILIKFLTTENSGIEFKERLFLDIIHLLLCNNCCYILHLPIHDLFTLHCMVQNPAEIKVSKLVATHIRCI